MTRATFGPSIEAETTRSFATFETYHTRRSWSRQVIGRCWRVWGMMPIIAS
jgi:hypothetical protein